MRVLLASLLLLALSACATTGGRSYSGVYVYGFETEAFYSYEGGDPYWVSADPDAYAALQAPLPRPIDPQHSTRVIVVVQGVLSPPGLYGHLGAYTRELHVTRVVSARLEDPS
jgi:hypothetical protein